jgi:hypothetical protein
MSLGLGGGDGGGKRDYIVIGDSPDPPPAVSFASLLPGSLASTTKRRLEPQLHRAKLVCDDTHIRDRQLRSELEERARMLRNEAALLRIRTVAYEKEKETLLKTWERRHARHYKEVLLFLSGTVLFYHMYRSKW